MQFPTDSKKKRGEGVFHASPPCDAQSSRRTDVLGTQARPCLAFPLCLSICSVLSCGLRTPVEDSSVASGLFCCLSVARGSLPSAYPAGERASAHLATREGMNTHEGKNKSKRTLTNGVGQSSTQREEGCPLSTQKGSAPALRAIRFRARTRSTRG
ncbi:hypothetical protein CCHR01_18800 [Colletotrichum chrysophilum]|uniref:Uncharacterized protein n=1 Tax=Colletotrichum chrysophilum TaxID=1836956 RepID=A0AAD8ZZY9_9PEZI|nr:hypothetical protein CCHR01_18800 [Colletotrichum chrysophilum]